MANISDRIELRKYLHHRLYLTSTAMCFLGLFGILLMIVNSELMFARDHDEEMLVNWLIKLTISISTILLIGLVLYYYKLDLDFYSVKNSVGDWRIGLTGTKIFLMILEIVICSIHPFPRSIRPNWGFYSTDTTDSLPLSYISLDVALGLPMFVRLYLVCRLIMFHSPLIHNASTQSLGYLNQVSMNFFFLMKTYLEKWPTRCLFTFGIMIFLIGSWSLRACDYRLAAGHVPMFDSMWLAIVTFTTVGYGDITPSSYCGRSVATLIVFTGIFSSALVISVLAQKLVLTRWEKYLYNFVLNIELAKSRKHQAANVIKFAIRIWYFKRKEKSKSIQCTKAQWKLVRSIQILKEVKLEQRKLLHSCVVLADLYSLQREGNSQTEKIIQQMSTTNRTIEHIEGKLIDVEQMMNDIQYKLNLLLSKEHIQQETMF